MVDGKSRCPAKREKKNSTRDILIPQEVVEFLPNRDQQMIEWAEAHFAMNMAEIKLRTKKALRDAEKLEPSGEEEGKSSYNNIQFIINLKQSRA